MKIKVLALGAVVTIAAALVPAQPASAATPGTIADAVAAMHDEALAYADYSAWADQADRVQNHTAAVLLGLIAGQERGEHFAELADLAGTVGPVGSNLLTAAEGEQEEATSLYPSFQATAVAEGDSVTAELFGELARDEGAHHSILLRAHRAVCGHGNRPPTPGVDPVPIVEQPAQASGQTLTNVRTAMRGEAFASARYLLFARQAAAEGRPWLDWFYTALASIELTEHYAALANRYGLVQSTQKNLMAAIAAEAGAITSYEAAAGRANAAGDVEAGARFAEIGSDERAHRVLLNSVLKR